MKYLGTSTHFFDSHHKVEEDDVCGRDHGHRFTVSVSFQVAGDAAFSQLSTNAIDEHVYNIAKEFDHRSINDMAPMHPSVHGLARYFWERLAILVPGLVRIEVADGTTSGVLTNDP